jgi:hypothetical protein
MYSKKSLFFVLFLMTSHLCSAMEIGYGSVDRRKPGQVFKVFSQKLEWRGFEGYDDSFLNNMEQKYGGLPTRGMVDEGENLESIIFARIKELINSMKKKDEWGFNFSVSQLVNYSIDCAKSLDVQGLSEFSQNVRIFMKGFKKEAIPGVSLIKRKIFSLLGSRLVMNLVLIGGFVALLYFVPDSKIAVIASIPVFEELKNIGSSSVENIRGRVYKNNDMYLRMKDYMSQELRRLNKNLEFLLKNNVRGKNIVMHPIEQTGDDCDADDERMEDEV